MEFDNCGTAAKCPNPAFSGTGPLIEPGRTGTLEFDALMSATGISTTTDYSSTE